MVSTAPHLRVPVLLHRIRDRADGSATGLAAQPERSGEGRAPVPRSARVRWYEDASGDLRGRGCAARVRRSRHGRARGGRRGATQRTASQLMFKAFGKRASSNGPAVRTPAAFGGDPGDRERLDWHLFQNGGVILYHKHQVLVEDAAWLTRAGYQLRELDAHGW